MFTSTATSDYSSSIGIAPLSMERNPTKWKYNTTSMEFAPNCPRCASSNTKFCYYNNYSLSQPRYFCKACRRYWTKGGSLRNVPVGGGCRKSRRARAKQGASPSRAGPTFVGPADDANNGAYIDMAAVFAKYVGQKEENEESRSPGGSSGSSDNVQASSLDNDSQFDDISMFEYQKPLDLVGRGDDQMQQAIPQLSMCQDISGQDFLYNGFDELEQGVLGGGLLWSEGTTLPPNFGLEQPMGQVQDFGPASPDDELRVCSNLVADNWGSFDLSAYEFYSTP